MSSDATAYREYSAQDAAVLADALAPFWLKTIGRIGSKRFADIATFAGLGLKLRRLGKQDMNEFLRIASLPMRDLMDENFDDEHLKAVLCWDGLIGSKLAPRSPNSAVLMLLYRIAGAGHGAHAIPASGTADLVRALYPQRQNRAVPTLRYATPRSGGCLSTQAPRAWQRAASAWPTARKSKLTASSPRLTRSRHF